VKKLKDRPFALLGVNLNGWSAPKLKEATDREQLTWRSFADPGALGRGPIATRWNLTSTPTFYVIDHQGVIRHKWVGSPGEKRIDLVLEKLIEEAEGKGKSTGK
jgi:peroxiredoxin